MGEPRGASASGDGRSVREHFEMALRVGRIGTWRWDVVSGLVEWDASMEELFGFPPGTFDGTYETYASRLHPDDRAHMRASLDAALADGRDEYVTDHRVLMPDGEVRWFSSTGRIVRDTDGAPVELIGVALDVTRQHQSDDARDAAVAGEHRAQAAAEAARRRLELLARASDLLDLPLDVDRVLQEVAELAVSEIADWCVVDVFEPTGAANHVAVAHRDPELVARARELQTRYPTELDTPRMRELLRTLQPLHAPVLDDATLARAIKEPDRLALMRELKLSSYIVVPLVAQHRVLGIMSLVSSDGRHLEEADVDLSMELARRAGATIAKAKLHTDLQLTAATLQTSLLPPSLPSIKGLVLSTFYRSGTDGVDIGGDFYDVFRTSEKHWWVVLGDVCGKGPAAAAMAAAVRYTIRTLALDTDDPADLLRWLNDVLRAEDWDRRFVTVFFASFEVPSDDSSAPIDLCVVSGGHPPGLVLRSDGAIEAVAARGTIVGVLPEVRGDAVDLELAPGDSLVLYTDGATEAFDADGKQIGERALREILAAVAAEPAAREPGDLAGRLADGVMVRARGGGLRDDLAVVTITRADTPRP
jgi:PAS domain S-box-containing protein